jgi:2-iminobutanoate/2-iminopropanoate deaminase
MPLQSVQTDRAPAAVGPYSQAMIFGDLLFCSGQIPLDAATGEMVGDEVAAQAERVFDNLEGVLAAGGSRLDLVIKATVFLTDMDHFAAMNGVYERRMGGHRPARSTIAVRALPKGALVEIEVIAARQG